MKLDTIVNQPVIEAGRFSLRPLRKSDAGLLHMYAGDERVARFSRSIPHPMPPGAAEAFVTRALAEDRSEDVWAMDGAEQGLGELLGLITLQRMDREQSQIGYWVAPALWNSGIASEAVQALLAANPQGCKTVFAEVFQDNAGSARVLTNAGFEYIGDAEAFSVARGAQVATWTYLKKLG
jgi:RimJ/RimL family protein N-acetyltransferase